jgi:hypothetical protein
MPAIAADPGWDRASLSVPYALYVFLYSALGAVTGQLTDRWGPRVVLTVGGCLLGGIMLIARCLHCGRFTSSLALWLPLEFHWKLWCRVRSECCVEYGSIHVTLSIAEAGKTSV